MVNYHQLGFSSFEEYVEEFFKTLLPTNKTYQYFVDWEKARRDAEKHIDKIFLLNSLTKVRRAERKNALLSLLDKYPSVAEALPILIAERLREKPLQVFDDKNCEFLLINFKLPPKPPFGDLEKIANFCEKCGIIDLLDEISNLYDYVLGVEVGLDSNTRKNRGGKIFEEMVERKLRGLIPHPYRIVRNDKNFSIYPLISSRSQSRHTSKTHDFVLYKDQTPVCVIECNFYNTSGSKPISIAESYVKMDEVARSQNIEFVWVTDGPGWHEMKEPLIRAMQEIKWVLNYTLLKLPFLTHNE